MKNMITKGLIYITSLLPISKPRIWTYRILGIKIGDNVNIGKGSIIWCKNLKQVVIEDDVHIGENVRIHSEKITLKRDSRINHNSRIRGRNEFHLGEGSFIGAGMFIDTTEKVYISDFVAIGPDSKIFTHDMSYQWVSAGLPFKTKEVKIGERTWIGSDVTIIAGIKIGRNNIIAPKAMVTKNIDDYGLFVGLPAKKIKDLEEKIIELKSRIDLLKEVKNHLIKYLPDRMSISVDDDNNEMTTSRNVKIKFNEYEKDTQTQTVFILQGSNNEIKTEMEKSNNILFDLEIERYTKKKTKIEREILSELRRMGLLFKPFE